MSWRRVWVAYMSADNLPSFEFALGKTWKEDHQQWELSSFRILCSDTEWVYFWADRKKTCYVNAIIKILQYFVVVVGPSVVNTRKWSRPQSFGRFFKFDILAKKLSWANFYKIANWVWQTMFQTNFNSFQTGRKEWMEGKLVL